MKSGLLLLALLPAVAVAQTKPATTATPASPASDPLDALVADSPFLPGTGGRNPAAGGAAGPLELRGIVFEDGAYVFSIYDQAAKEAVWVRLDERGHPFMARSFNREKDALTVEHQGRTLVLSLQPAKMASTAGSAPPQSPSPLPGSGGQGMQGGPGPQSGPGNSGQSPPVPVPGASAGGPAPQPSGNTSAAEAQRLQNLADEIRRRRNAGPPMNLPSNKKN